MSVVTEEVVTNEVAGQDQTPVEVKTINENAAIFSEKSQDSVANAQAKLTIDPRRIVVIPERNTRQDRPTNLASLKDSFKKEGVRLPVEVYFSDGTEPGIQKNAMVLVTGYTRQALGSEIASEYEKDGKTFHIPYTVIEIPSSVKDASTRDKHLFLKNLSENFFRNELTENDTIKAILRFTEGKTDIGTKAAGEIASYFNKSAAWVTQRLNMTKQLAPSLQERLSLRQSDAGFIPGSVAMEVMKIGVPEGKKFDDLSEEEKVAAYKAQEEYVANHEVPGGGLAITRDKVKADLANREVPENGAAPVEEGDKPRTLKVMVDEIQSMIMPDAKAGEDIGTDFAKQCFLPYQAGKITIKQFRNRLEKLSGVSKKNRVE